MKHLRILLSLLALVACSALAFAKPAAVIHGTLVNGTNSSDIANYTVELRREGEKDKPGTLIAKTKTTKNGKFTFAVPAKQSDALLVARAVFDNYPYEVPAYDGGKRLSAFDVNIDPGKVRLPVFDTTHSLVPLDLSVQHMDVQPQPGGLKCGEWLIVNNPTKKTFLGLGEDNATVLLDLPKGAKNVHLDPKIIDAKIIKKNGSYAISKDIPPTLGTQGTPIIVHYEMDWPTRWPWGRKLDLSRQIQYPTRFFFVQRKQEFANLKVTGPQLSQDRNVKMNIEGKEQKNILNMVGDPKADKPALVPGDSLKIHVSSPINPSFWAFLGFLVLLIILIPVALLVRSKGGEEPGAESDKSSEPEHSQSVKRESSTSTILTSDALQTAEAKELIDKIAQLDEAHEAGEMEDEDYRQQRRACKEALIRLSLSGDS